MTFREEKVLETRKGTIKKRKERAKEIWSRTPLQGARGGANSRGKKRENRNLFLQAGLGPGLRGVS